MDLSVVAFYDASELKLYYEVSSSNPTLYYNQHENPTFGLYVVSLFQNEKQRYEEWTVNTFDGFMSDVGGFSCIVWQLAAIFFGWY